MRIRSGIFRIFCFVLPLAACGHSGEVADLYGTTTSVIWEDAPEGDQLALIAQGSRQPLATAQVRDGRAVFRFDGRRAQIASGCFTIRSFNPQSPVNKDKTGTWFTNQVAAENTRLSAEIVRTQRELSNAQGSVRQAQSWLNRNPRTYRNGTCVTPQLRAAPTSACLPSKSTSYAEKGCNEAFVGCLLVSEGAGFVAGQIGTSVFGKEAGVLAGIIASLGASQACAQRMSEKLGTKYDIWSAAQTLMADLSVAAVKTSYDKGDVAGLFVGGGAAALTMRNNYNQCVRDVSQNCTTRYRTWRNEPNALRRSCDQYLAVLRGGDQTDAIRTRLNSLTTSQRELSGAPPQRLQRCELR